MSLFPAAGLSSDDNHRRIKTEKPETDEWLRNKSYSANDAAKLIQLQLRSEESSSSEESDVEVKKEKKRHRPAPIKSESSLPKKAKLEAKDDPKLAKVAYVVEQLDNSVPRYKSDKIKDMDNVHFSRPYKVLIPKFYRDLIYCVGTPKWKYLQLRETRKKKKRKRCNNEKDNRYFNQKLPASVGYACTDIKLSSHTRFSESFMKIPDIEEEEKDPEHEGGGFLEDPLKKTTENLNRKIRENPHDVESWLKLVEWQDEIMKDHIARGKKHLMSEKKVEILNQAIKANPKLPKLQLMRVRLQSDLISDVSALDKEWQNILFRFPDNIEVWKAYVLYINCNNFTAFSLKRTRRAYGHCIEILRSIKNGTYKQEASSEISAENRLVQLLSECAHFLSATGHTEQWVALYLCMLELNFRGPPAGTSWTDTMEYLKLFFNGGTKLIGDPSSKGFHSWVTKHETGGWVTEESGSKTEEEEDVDDDDADYIDSDKTLTENWLKVDHVRCENHWLPWRPEFDGDECDDEERKVTFSDLKDLMFIVDGIESKICILRDFLHLLGSAKNFGSTESEPFSNQSIFYFTFSQQPMRRFEEVFVTKPLLIGKSQDNTLGTLNSSKHNYICEVFSQLLNYVQDQTSKDKLCTLYMSYFEHRAIAFYNDNKPKDLKECGKQAKKTAKYILSKNPDLLRVWCSYGVVEWLSHKRSEACKIFQTTLTMSSRMISELDRKEKSKLACHVHFLCRTFAQLHFATCNICSQNGDEATKQCVSKIAVLDALTAFGKGYKFSDLTSKSGLSQQSTDKMKALAGFVRLTEEFQSLYEQYEYEKDMSNLTEDEYLSTYFDIVCCHFLYCATSGHLKNYDILDEAIAFLRKNIEKGSMQAKIDLEHIYILYFMYMRELATQNRIYYRKLVYDAVTAFPHNPYFAELLGEIDMPSYLCGNVRRQFTRICSVNSSSVLPWLSAIEFELSRRRRIIQSTKTDFGEANSLLDIRIHNLFERSLSPGANPGSVVLWRAYILAQAEMDKSKVNGVYTRALDSCSWSRDVHLDILSHHPDKLAEVVNNMSKKGLRLRTPIEEIQLLMTV